MQTGKRIVKIRLDDEIRKEKEYVLGTWNFLGVFVKQGIKHLI